MSFDINKLYSLLPAVYQIRDAERGMPLRALLGVISEQVADLQENLDQLYDDQFIETCASWVVPYIGELVGITSLDLPDSPWLSPRAEVANTIGYRRRKGTAVVIEQLARDASGWDVAAVEFFKLLITSQNVNHVRPDSPGTPDLRQMRPLALIGTPFDTIARTGEVRLIANGGKYNIPNIGVFIYRIRAYSLTNSPASAVDATRYRFSPLGNDTALYTSPRTEPVFSSLAQPVDVPIPIPRSFLAADMSTNGGGDYYGPDKSLILTINGAQVPASNITVCNLSDSGASSWGYTSSTQYVVDPALGRLVLPPGAPAKPKVQVTYFYGFSADMGGGEYDRSSTIDLTQPNVIHVPADQPTIAAALHAIVNAVPPAGGVVEITDSGRYLEPGLTINAGAVRIEVRAANECRPTVVLTAPLAITGTAGGEVDLNGLIICGNGIAVTGGLEFFNLTHCTLVPGFTIANGAPIQTALQISLSVSGGATNVQISYSITGAMAIANVANAQITDSIVDAQNPTAAAYDGQPGDVSGGSLLIQRSTVIGKVRAQTLTLASNCIFLSALAPADTWPAPVVATDQQQGCLRFSYLPLSSITPPRYNCQPTGSGDSQRVTPLFLSTNYGSPAYCLLHPNCATEILQGADDEAEMGAFHMLFIPQRRSYLLERTNEYLRFGLQAGLFYAGAD